MTPAAIGLRPHSGWAALVVVAGPTRFPQVVGRRRIEIADPKIPGSKQPYHAAENLELRKAARLLARCERGSLELARRAFREALDDLRGRGYAAVNCGLLLASGRALPPLESILASHALIHTADGEHFRNALAAAAEGHELAVTRIREREVLAAASEKLGVPADQLARRVADMGKPLGSPWTQDQKLATLVGWLALAAGRRGR